MIKLKPYRQKPGFCGPSCIKIVLELYGVKKSENELGRMTDCSPTIGTSGAKIVEAAKALGFRAFQKDGASIADIQKWVKKGVPVIVNWFSVNEGHYSVAVEVTKKSISLMDPELARVRRMSVEKFEHFWFDFSPVSKRTRKSLVLKRMIVIQPK
jgi:ABC-type bacteriocin/lantibiotic exporter with double-glycine peptidase domain